MSKIKRELWKDGHYHAVLRNDKGKIVSAPRWSANKEKVNEKINKRIDIYNKKSENYSHPLEAQTNYVILRDKGNSDMPYHYKIFVPSNRGGYYATVTTRNKLSPSEIIERSRRFIGGYGDNVNWEKTQILGLEQYA